MSVGNGEVVCLRIVVVPIDAYSRRGMFQVTFRPLVFGKQSANSGRIHGARSILQFMMNGLVLLNADDAVEYTLALTQFLVPIERKFPCRSQNGLLRVVISSVCSSSFLLYNRT